MRIAPAVLVILLTAPADGGGMVLPVRGVRSLEQAGALVAGADDADALWLDPAGLARNAKADTRALLFDAAYLYDTVDHTRIDASGAALPKQTNQQPGTAIPTLAGALALGDELVIAGGIASPYMGQHKFADASPGRYASLATAGSTFVAVTVGAAYAVSKQLRVGATLQDLITSTTTRVIVSACPGATSCAAEDPAFDAILQVDQTDYFAPSGSIGVQYDATPTLTLGATIQAPTKIGSAGKLTLTPPTSSMFQGAKVLGDAASVSYTLPASVRAGVELRPRADLRIELALDVELWSMHDKVSIAPDNVQLQTATQTFALQAMDVPRHYRTSFAPAIGVEWHAGVVMLGAGYAYETAAAPAGDVSVLTVDAAKHVVGIGGGYADAGWQIGAAAGFAKLADVDVSLADASVPQLQPIRDPHVPVTVNAGHYASSYLVAGLRFARRF